MSSNTDDYERAETALNPGKRDHHADDVEPRLDMDDTLVEDNNQDREIFYQGTTIRLYPLDPKTPLIKTQIAVLLFVFITLGLNDQATGMLIPILSETYKISQVTIANIFLTQTFGYFSACFIADPILFRYGQRGCLSISCLLIAIPSVVLFSQPSIFFIYVLCYYPIGMGIGLLDSLVNYVFSSFTCYKNELLGCVHGIYGACAFIAPIFIDRLGKENWNKFFLVQGLVAFIGAILCFYVFRFETKEKYEYKMKMSELTTQEETNVSMIQLLKQHPLIPLYACALFFYLGTEVGTASWIFTYLLEFKEGNSTPMSWIVSVYWAGLTIGRLYFGMMIDKWFVNEYQALKFFIKLAVLCTMCFVLLGGVYSHSALYFISLGFSLFGCGMFIGPIFPLLSIIGVDILDEHVQVKGLSIAISWGSIGGALMPFFDGLLMTQFGLASLPFLILLTTVICYGAINLYPLFIKDRDSYFNPKPSALGF